MVWPAPETLSVKVSGLPSDFKGWKLHIGLELELFWCASLRKHTIEIRPPPKKKTALL